MQEGIQIGFDNLQSMIMHWIVLDENKNKMEIDLMEIVSLGLKNEYIKFVDLILYKVAIIEWAEDKFIRRDPTDHITLIRSKLYKILKVQ